MKYTFIIFYEANHEHAGILLILFAPIISLKQNKANSETKGAVEAS
jgi:hypothetical protein